MHRSFFFPWNILCGTIAWITFNETFILQSNIQTLSLTSSEVHVCNSTKSHQRSIVFEIVIRILMYYNGEKRFSFVIQICCYDVDYKKRITNNLPVSVSKDSQCLKRRSLKKQEEQITDILLVYTIVCLAFWSLPCFGCQWLAILLFCALWRHCCICSQLQKTNAFQFQFFF